MKALILVGDGVEDLEFYYPYYRLIEHGFTVDVAGPEVGSVTGKHGYKVETNLSLQAVKAEGYDVLVLPGGKGPETVRLYPGSLEVTRTMLEGGKVVACICHGAQVLISAKVTEGRKATCWKGIRDDLIAAGAEYVDEPVVVDGTLVTSRRPDDLPHFCREMFALLQVESMAS